MGEGTVWWGGGTRSRGTHFSRYSATNRSLCVALLPSPTVFSAPLRQRHRGRRPSAPPGPARGPTSRGSGWRKDSPFRQYAQRLPVCEDVLRLFQSAIARYGWRSGEKRAQRRRDRQEKMLAGGSHTFIASTAPRRRRLALRTLFSQNRSHCTPNSAAGNRFSNRRHGSRDCLARVAVGNALRARAMDFSWC